MALLAGGGGTFGDDGTLGESGFGAKKPAIFEMELPDPEL
jgi:hypothetical protein